MTATTRITLDRDEVAALQDAISYHYLNPQNNYSSECELTETERWDAEQLARASKKIDRALARMEES